ncbi:Lysophospholipid acyltransferase LPEAT2 [Hondaea fermentalgiana]|uniref:Lysophospholipid acyltransferase LPEAT2 n=1 Tax=Hondaea fermentalgiana TaxID=2315210 RepID=A0A2R5G6I6_9STRA|nr:Lysophospholipid acyltransferase LPEAT2 [Hondaea fermentalgiana]|eukprot:GBG25939.1 Lysophospholipid acyltransferase LPEAT2 [Hondaea fermentalgiana]
MRPNEAEARTSSGRRSSSVSSSTSLTSHGSSGTGSQGSAGMGNRHLISANPFGYNAPVTVYEFVKMVFFVCSGIAIVRALLVFLLVLLAYLCARVATLGLDRDVGVYTAPMPRWRRLALKPVSGLSRAALFVFGFYHIEVIGSPSPEACLFTPNHVGLADLLLMYWLLLPSALSKAEAFKVPIVGTLFRGLQVIPVQRDSAEDKKRAVETIKRFADSRMHETDPDKRFPPILVFPQGTTANQDVITMFQRGAFTPGCPVQPVSLYYRWKHFNPAYIVCRKYDYYFLRHFCQFTLHARVRFLPLHMPSKEERENATLFADNVRNEIAADIHADTTEHCFEDAMLYRSALNIEEKRHKPRLFHVAKPEDKIDLGGLELKQIKDLFDPAQRAQALALKDAKVILERFVEADTDGDGFVDLPEFARAVGFDPESDQARRLFQFFDRDMSGMIDFRELLTGMATVHPFSSSKDKIRFAFELYDQDGDGLVSESELWRLWSLATESSNSQRFTKDSRQELRDLISAVRRRRSLSAAGEEASETATDGELRITLEEFQSLVARDSEVVATALSSMESRASSRDKKKSFFPFLMRRSSSSRFADAHLDGRELNSVPADAKQQSLKKDE